METRGFKFNYGFTHISNINALLIKFNNIFAGTSAYGIFRSTNNGDNWEDVSARLISQYGVKALITNSYGHIFAGAWGTGFFRTTNNGENWYEINNGLGIYNYYAQCFAINSSQHIFAGESAGLWRSTNNGDSWVRTTNGIFATNIVCLGINSSGHIFAGVFRSTDNGNNWTHLNGLQSGPNSIVIAENGNIYVGTPLGVFKSVDNGDSWLEKSNGITNTYCQSILINSDGYIFAGTWGGIFISTNEGESWEERNSGLTSTNIRALAINSNGYIFAGTAGGVFVSTDAGNSWEELNSGLTNLDIYALAITPNGYVFAGSWGDGVFRSINSTTSVRDQDQAPSSFSLSQNYPNPFNPITKIQFTISDFGYTTFKVFDVLGREVATLVNEEKQPGVYETEFDGSQLSSGIYFYKLQTENYSSIKKMIYLK